MSTSPRDAAAIRSAVRRNTIWAAGAAVIMLYYGLYHGLGGDPQPDLPARFRIGSWLVLYSLQIGGGLMVLSAILSLTGAGPALLFDALASVVIGACLAAAGMLLMSGIEMQSLLLILFGAVFIHSGYRNWREYFSLAAPDVRGVPAEAQDAVDDRRTL